MLVQPWGRHDYLLKDYQSLRDFNRTEIRTAHAWHVMRGGRIGGGGRLVLKSRVAFKS